MNLEIQQFTIWHSERFDLEPSLWRSTSEESCFSRNRELLKSRDGELHEKTSGTDRQDIGSVIGSVFGALTAGMRRLGIWLHNRRRRLLRGGLPDYVVFELADSISERAPVEPLFYQLIPGDESPMSLESLTEAFRKVAGDPDIGGIVLIVRGRRSA